jgi:hypothetical protein
MKIIFNDGTEMECIQVNGAIRYIQGANRDTLEFVFTPELYTISEVDEAFSNANNLKKVTLQKENEIGVHENYTIRTGLTLQPFVIVPETSTSPEVSEQRIFVTMAQKTYAEIKIDSLQETIDVLVLESLGVN